jgi:twitching motility protein PilJ
MKLRNKVLLIFGLGLIGLSAGFYAVSRVLLLRSYAALEEQQTKNNVRRVLDSIANDLDNLDRQALDYGKWDDTYQFVVDRNEDYIETNYPEEGSTLINLRLNWLAIINTSNEIIFSQSVDFNEETRILTSEDFLTKFSASIPLLNHTEIDGSVNGILLFSEGPMLIASRPIVTSNKQGPVRGAVIMGRYLTQEEIDRLKQLTNLPDIAIELFDTKQLSSDFQQARQVLTDGKISNFVKPLSQEKVAGYTVIKDLLGKPALLLRVSEERAIYAQGQASLNYLVLTIFITGVLFSAVTLLLLEKSILSRIGRLNSSVNKIGTSGISSERVLLTGRDELSNLANTFNSTLARLEQSQQEIQENAERLQYLNRVIVELSRNESLLQGDAQQATRAFTEAAAKTLSVERVSVWLYNLERTQLTCLDLYECSSEKHSTGMAMRKVDFPSYFEVLAENVPIIVNDVHTDSRTQSLADSYLKPLKIASLLDVPIEISGIPAGLVRCEQIEIQHQWKPEEQVFISAIANLVSLALENETLQGEVRHLLDVVSSVEEGDLQIRARVSDRATGLVADTLNRLMEELAFVLAGVLGTAQRVSQGVSNLEEIASTVVTNAEGQAQSVAQVLNLSEQVEKSAQNSAEQVKATNNSLFLLSKGVEQGQKAIATLTEEIRVLEQGTDRIVQQMKTLGEFVGLADQFVQDQNEVVSRTQVLAMNAALVAARASEQKDPQKFGIVARDFEAIAEQVSKLAQQTNDSLAILEQRTTQIHNVVSTIDADVQNLGGLVQSFTRGAKKSDRVFQNVQIVTAQTIGAGNAVAQSSQKIVTAAQTTARAMRDIAALATRTTQLTQKARSQSEHMDNLSKQLLQNIQFFRLPAQAIERVDLDERNISSVTTTVAAEVTEVQK